MNELMERNPNIIASEIEAIKTQTKTIVLAAAMEIGKRLIEVKAMLPHGTWGTWLKDNVDYSERTAQNLMALHTTYSGMQTAAIEGVSYSKAVALLGIESEALVEAVETHDITGMSTQEVEDLAQQLRDIQKEKAGMLLTLDLLTGADEREKTALREKKTAEAAREAEEQKRIKAEAETKRLEGKLEAAEKREPEAPVEVIVEKIPAETQAELEKLRQVAAKAPSAPVIKFRQTYDDFQAKALLIFEHIAEIEKDDPDTAKKYREATRTACTRIISKLGGGAE